MLRFVYLALASYAVGLVGYFAALWVAFAEAPTDVEAVAFWGAVLYAPVLALVGVPVAIAARWALAGVRHTAAVGVVAVVVGAAGSLGAVAMGLVTGGVGVLASPEYTLLLVGVASASVSFGAGFAWAFPPRAV